VSDSFRNIDGKSKQVAFTIEGFVSRVTLDLFSIARHHLYARFYDMKRRTD
jgi:hypothetical protein